MSSGKPIIIGRITIEVKAVNIINLQICIDGKVKYEGKDTSWVFNERIFGMHELKAIGYGKYEMAEDSIEILIFNI